MNMKLVRTKAALYSLMIGIPFVFGAEEVNSMRATEWFLYTQYVRLSDVSVPAFGLLQHKKKHYAQRVALSKLYYLKSRYKTLPIHNKIIDDVHRKLLVSMEQMIVYYKKQKQDVDLFKKGTALQSAYLKDRSKLNDIYRSMEMD